ncbi:MAG: proP [Moraxellaceae bacterium]|jgi:MFS family permease|nr:proP [Moraxellaceae bacterium]
MIPQAASAFFINRDFALYWGVRVASMMAFQMLAVAVGWQVYDITGSMLALGYIGLAGFLPAVFLVLLVGHVADRFDRRRVVQAGHGLEAVVALVLAGGSLQGWLSVTHIFVGVFLLGVGKAFSAPTLSALLPGLVSQQELPRAVGASSAAMQAAIILGPAVGGFLYIAGPTAVYAAGALLFVGSVLMLGLVRARPAPLPAEAAAGDNSVFAGLRFIRSKPVVFGAISLDLFAVLLGGATAMLPVIAKDLLHTGPEGLGLLRSAPAVGALLVSFWLARNPIHRRTGHVMFGGVAVFGLATIVLGLSPYFWLSLAALLVLGGADMLSVVIRSSLVQLETPDAMRGRVSAVNFLFIGASNQLGEFRSGVSAALMGLVPSIVFGGVGALVVVGLWMWWFPELARRDRLVEDHETPR